MYARQSRVRDHNITGWVAADGCKAIGQRPDPVLVFPFDADKSHGTLLKGVVEWMRDGANRKSRRLIPRTIYQNPAILIKA
jgi:hypothetical protein